jgi:hypothetical protein
MQSLSIKRKHYTKTDHFSRHSLFSTIYLLQEWKLNHRDYFEKEINMGNIIQATENDVHMYSKFGDFTFYVFL